MLLSDDMHQQLYHAPIPFGVVTAVEWKPEETTSFFPGIPSQPLPEHIRVAVTCHPEPRSNIKIEVWLPTETWNGDLLGVGNGGSAGMIVPILMTGPLRMGFAVANTDMGTSAGPDSGVGNPAVWEDFGHRATHLMTLAAKTLIQVFYGKPQNHAYFTGNSTGGQQALMEAQRYPEDYDGILSLDPAFDRTNLHIAFLRDWLALGGRAAEGLFTKEDEARMVAAILENCGEIGGRRPGDDFLYHPAAITLTRDVLEKAGITERQIQARLKIQEGTTDPANGERIYEPTLMPGSEAEDLSLVSRCQQDFAHGYLYILRWALGADFDLTTFDFHRDVQKVREILDGALNATSPDLAPFRDRGGKLLLIHGTADPIIPYTSSIRYYCSVQDRMGDTQDFFRLFLVPGMAHGSGGPGLQDAASIYPASPRDSRHSALFALKEWVETGKAPDALWPVAFQKGNPLSPFLEGSVAYERQILPYRRQGGR